MPADIDTLEAIARAATQGLWHARKLTKHTRVFDCSGSTLVANSINAPALQPSNAAHIAAFSPERVLALLALVRAAKSAYRVMDQLIPNEPETDALAEALAHLLEME